MEKGSEAKTRFKKGRGLQSIGDVCSEPGRQIGIERVICLPWIIRLNLNRMDKLKSQQHIRIQSNLKSYPLEGVGEW